jgi:hypothetical protein
MSDPKYYCCHCQKVYEKWQCHDHEHNICYDCEREYEKWDSYDDDNYINYLTPDLGENLFLCKSCSQSLLFEDNKLYSFDNFITILKKIHNKLKNVHLNLSN